MNWKRGFIKEMRLTRVLNCWSSQDVLSLFWKFRGCLLALLSSSPLTVNNKTATTRPRNPRMFAADQKSKKHSLVLRKSVLKRQGWKTGNMLPDCDVNLRLAITCFLIAAKRKARIDFLNCVHSYVFVFVLLLFVLYFLGKNRQNY